MAVMKYSLTNTASYILEQFIKGLMQHHKEIVEYFNTRGVSAIFLFRRNLLRRMISILANSYDRDAKLLNGTHKSHVHSPHEAEILARYKPAVNATLLVPNLRQVEETTKKALEYFKSTRHIILYYEDVVKNRTKLVEVQEFLKVPRMELRSRQLCFNGCCSVALTAILARRAVLLASFARPGKTNESPRLD
ncbi:hypothetical protein QQP08_008315 [Theobroma cacao]|nr:hypothetical protein QQP08_008315 [Theobroma cacao]